MALKIDCSLGDCLHILGAENMLVTALLARGFDHLMVSPSADFFAPSRNHILDEPQVAIAKAKAGAPGWGVGAISAVRRFLLESFGRRELVRGRLGACPLAGGFLLKRRGLRLRLWLVLIVIDQCTRRRQDCGEARQNARQ